MKRVSIIQLRRDLSRYLRTVQAGEELEVTDRGRPIARIVPIGGPKLIPATRRFSEIRNRKLKPLKMKTTTLEMLLEDRGQR